MNKLLQLAKKNLTVLLNAGSIVGTTAVTSLLGFAYWWVAARLFSPDALGLATAMISVMSLLGTISMLGLGTLLTGELTRRPGQEWALINAALIAVGGAGIVAGVVFAFLAPFISPNLDNIGSNIIDITLFALGVGFTALTMVLDQALIGILRGGLQLGRNTVFGVAKLGALIASFYFFKSTGLIIYVTWLIGNVISLSVLFVQRSKKVAYGTPGEIPISASRSLTISGPLALSGPLAAIERSIKLPCPDCGVLSANSASYCLNCGYPFSPTVEISSVRPQLMFDYGMIGLSETPMLRKRRQVSGNFCPECGNATADNAIYCASCGYPLTPTIEIPNVRPGLPSFGIETIDTMPLLTAIKREKTRQTLSAESTQLFLTPVKDAQNPAAIAYTPLPIEAEETLNMSGLPGTTRSIEAEETLNMSGLPGTTLTSEDEENLKRIDLKRSALFNDDEKTLNLSNLPQTPLPDEVKAQAAPDKPKKNSVMPQWDLLRKLGGAAIQHHVVNLILLAPTQLLPIMVTILISNDATAYFYFSFMLANFVFSLTYSLTTVLHAVSSAQPSILAQKIRFTFSLSLIASLGANLVLQVGAGLLLESFGSSYAHEGTWCLRILALAVLPIIVKSHYLAICRVYDRTRYLILPVAIGSILELGLAAVGAEKMGLLGVSLGWFAALILEAIYMSRTVYKAAYPVNVNTLAGKKVAKA